MKTQGLYTCTRKEYLKAVFNLRVGLDYKDFLDHLKEAEGFSKSYGDLKRLKKLDLPPLSVCLGLLLISIGIVVRFELRVVNGSEE